MKKSQRIPTTPQAILRARFAELADSHGIALEVRVQTGKVYFTMAGTLNNTTRFMEASFPRAWITSGAGEATYRLPDDDVERVLAEAKIDPDWLRHQDGAALRMAEHIREAGDYERLPILADALEEGGCDNAAILSHCRASAPHSQTCWVIELLLGPDKRRDPKEIRMRAMMEFEDELRRNYARAHGEQ